MSAQPRPPVNKWVVTISVTFGTLMAAIESAVPVNVLSAALYARFRSREERSFAGRMLSAMRKGFGGHVEPKARGS